MAKMQYLSQFANHRAQVRHCGRETEFIADFRHQLSAASQKTSTLWERAV